MTDSLLPMFFDEDFVPHAYLDAIFDQSIGSTKTLNQPFSTSLKQIELLQRRTTMLSSHLDYYTNGLTSQLEEQIHTLQQSNLVISYSYDQSHSKPTSSTNFLSHEESSQTERLKPTTRLEYYIDSLMISVNALNEQIIQTSKDLSPKSKQESNKEDDITTKLWKLSKSKENLTKVANSLETIRSITEITSESPINSKSSTNLINTAPTTSKSSTNLNNYTAIQLNHFSESLDTLKSTIIEQFKVKATNESETEIDNDLLKKIESLILLLPIFKNLNQFYSLYSTFVKVLQNEVSNYLQSKVYENKDELFESILK